MLNGSLSLFFCFSLREALPVEWNVLQSPVGWEKGMKIERIERVERMLKSDVNSTISL